jgi:hypothetical protein
MKTIARLSELMSILPYYAEWAEEFNRKVHCTAPDIQVAKALMLELQREIEDLDGDRHTTNISPDTLAALDQRLLTLFVLFKEIWTTLAKAADEGDHIYNVWKDPYADYLRAESRSCVRFFDAMVDCFHEQEDVVDSDAPCTRE